MSIWSYPDRGPWGDAGYRGNASGHVYRDLYGALRPGFVVDPCVGSGTAVEAAESMGIEAVGLDLSGGFNLLRESILEVVGRPADLCVSHLPYHDMIVYSGGQYPGAHPDDLSRCESLEAYFEKAQQALLNQRDATAPGGHYATLIGDLRRNGRYHSLQAEFLARMPADELRGVIVKAQHNTRSQATRYRGRPGGGLPRIAHEYLLVWQRPERLTSVLVTLRRLAQQGQQRVRSTWTAIVRQAMVALGGRAELQELYAHIEGVAREGIARNRNWQAKVRQVLQRSPAFVRLDRGQWALARNRARG